MGVSCMKISAINYQTYPQQNFNGEKTKNKLKNAAGAAAIAIAASAPMAEAEAQYFVPYTPYYYNYVQKPTVTKIPNCFIIGDITNSDSDDKSMSQVFNEIDRNGNSNGVISAKEVMLTEQKNWNETNLYPYTDEQMADDAIQFNTISKMYNENGSDPATMNYREYKSAMNDYMENKNVDTFIDLMQILTIPYLYTPPYYYYPVPHYHRPYGPPPPHHRHTPPPHHRHDGYHRHW